MFLLQDLAAPVSGSPTAGGPSAPAPARAGGNRTVTADDGAAARLLTILERGLPMGTVIFGTPPADVVGEPHRREAAVVTTAAGARTRWGSLRTAGPGSSCRYPGRLPSSA